MSEQSKFIERVNELRDEGLIDIKFFPGEVSEIDREQFLGDVNKILDDHKHDRLGKELLSFNC